VLYEYTYNAPTNYVPKPDFRWNWNISLAAASDNYPRLSYAIDGLGSCKLYNSENGGSSWATLRGSTIDGVFYEDSTEILPSWNPSDYRAYGEKAGYLDSNQLIVPDRVISPILWKQDNGYGNDYVGMQCFGTNCTIWYRSANKSKSGGNWSNWSSWRSVSGRGWGDVIGSAYPLKNLETKYTWFQYEVYVAQSGFTNSEKMFIDAQANVWKRGGESGISLGFADSRNQYYSD